MHALLVSHPKIVKKTSPSLMASADQKGRVSSRLLHYANQPWATALVGFLTTAMILLPTEYEYPIRSVMHFLSLRRF